MDYHIDPIQAAKVAQKARVKKLVFNHIVPPVTNVFARMMFLDGVAETYEGEAVLGEDGMRFDLDPKN